jgi:hypothetical protein
MMTLGVFGGFLSVKQRGKFLGNLRDGVKLKRWPRDGYSPGSNNYPHLYTLRLLLMTNAIAMRLCIKLLDVKIQHAMMLRERI